MIAITETVAITGHTAGVGKALMNLLHDEGHSAVGFALDTGYDITDEKSRDLILSSVLMSDANCFVNNAHAKEGQMELLISFFNHWKDDPKKTIINIGSLATSVLAYNDPMIPYIARKEGLRQTCFQLQRKPHKCRLIHVRFGFIDTEFSHSIISNTPNLPPVLTAVQAAVEIKKLIFNANVYVQEIAITARRNHESNR